MRYSQAIPFTRFFFRVGFHPSRGTTTPTKSHQTKTSKLCENPEKIQNIQKKRDLSLFDVRKKLYRRKYTKLCKSAASGDVFFSPFPSEFFSFLFFQASESEAFEKAETQTVEKLSPSLRLRKHLRTHHSLFRYPYIVCRFFTKGFSKNRVIPQVLSEGDLIKLWRGGVHDLFWDGFFRLYFCSWDWSPQSPKKHRKSGVNIQDEWCWNG